MELLQIIIAIAASWGVMLTPLWFPWLARFMTSWWDAFVEAGLLLGKHVLAGAKIIALDLRVQYRQLNYQKMVEELEDVSFDTYIALKRQRDEPQPCHEEMLIQYPPLPEGE